MGYPDFQRLSTRTAALLTDVTWASDTETESGTVDVSAFANVTVIGGCTTPTLAVCALQWLSDTGTSPAKIAQYFVVHSSITNDLVLRVPVLMPYVKLFANTSKSGSTGVLDLLADNGPAGPRTVPQITGHDFGLQSIAADSNEIVFPDDYYSGPLTVSYYAPVANLVYVLETYDETVTGTIFATLQASGGGWNTATVNAPPSAWWVQYTNTTTMTETLGVRISS